MQWRFAEGKFQSTQEQQLTVLNVAAGHVCDLVLARSTEAFVAEVVSALYLGLLRTCISMQLQLCMKFLSVHHRLHCMQSTC